jgi:hypothetical protein
VRTITRKPRLLVKMPAAGQQSASLKITARGADVNFSIEPLFNSIHSPAKLGIAAASEWHIVTTAETNEEINAWDLSHSLVGSGNGLGLAGGAPEFAEPDLEQQWIFGTEPQHAFALTRACEKASEQNGDLPTGEGHFWFRDAGHSQLEKARDQVGNPKTNRVRIAHFDTGFDPQHSTKPQFLLEQLQKNFVNDKLPDDATDRSSGLVNNLGHGTGTLSILAGASVEGIALGGAAFLDVIPIRVADSVVLFKNSAIAQAFDYVHELWANPDTRAHVITMSMGGLASAAWADAVNALYELGVFIVTAAGNNFGNLPTRNIVYPARFKRVVAACGVMANGTPYADLPLKIMAGNYGPDSKMATAIAAFTPNTPWARLGCREIVDFDGRGTSAATPQVAATAALWIQKNKKQWDAYSEGWMRVEAVRKALFDSARLSSKDLRTRLGNGIIQAEAALGSSPAKEAQLKKQPEDSASFPFLRVITGFGIAAPGAQPGARQRMLELEALQLTQQSQELEQLLPDPDMKAEDMSLAERQRFIDALVSTPGASDALRKALGGHASAQSPRVSVPAVTHKVDEATVKRAMNPSIPTPTSRKLRVFAFDPLVGTRLDTMDLNETILDIHWENDLQPGPVGEYLEVVDIDPSSGVCYAPVDLNQPYPLSQSGFAPSETNPQFHQQMVYAVAMKTIEHFEHALGRAALWAPRFVKTDKGIQVYYVRQLRIYPHAIREANAFYSPDKKALLLGYFTASKENAGDNMPGQVIFCSLSHDIIAHETTHALLDGLHRRFREATNPDVLAFHEAFADIVALFQHFTLPQALRAQISKTRGDLAKQNMLGELAQQFGQGIGQYGALRSAIGGYDKDGKWQMATPTVNDYDNASESHDRGAILVAAVFDAFLNIYRRRSRDLIRLATGGTGVLPEGDIPYDLVNRLADEASKTANHILNICIRALDYCPPVDLTFGDYIRALITADKDLVPNDPLGYRVAFIEAFRRRGIYPKAVRNLSTESVCWNNPPFAINVDGALQQMSLSWDLHSNRRGAFYTSRRNARIFHDWAKDNLTDEQSLTLGFYCSEAGEITVNNVKGTLSPFEVHSVRPVRRVGPDGQQEMDMVIEITQNWIPADGNGDFYRGGCTLIIGLEARAIRYCIRKRVAHPGRIDSQQSFRLGLAQSSLRNNYFTAESVSHREPFAMLHRCM